VSVRSSSFRAFAPATVANLGPGFDVLGLALAGAGDVVTARFDGASGVRIERIEGDGGALPLEASANTAGIAAERTLSRAGVAAGVALVVEKGLPLGSGLGSSAASAAAAAFAVNGLVGSPLRKAELIGPCLDAEAAVSGRHADNVAAAILGGLVLVRSIDPLDVVRLPIPEGLTMVVVTPRVVVGTRQARAVLPASIPLAAHVKGSGDLAALVAACFSGDLGLFARALNDEIATPARAPLIPGCDDVMRAARDAGALGASISGSGPSIFAVCRSERSARETAAAMVAAFTRAGVVATTLISPADAPGVRRA
jgi:homoserine kinase